MVFNLWLPIVIALLFLFQFSSSFMKDPLKLSQGVREKLTQKYICYHLEEGAFTHFSFGSIYIVKITLYKIQNFQIPL